MLKKLTSQLKLATLFAALGFCLLGGVVACSPSLGDKAPSSQFVMLDGSKVNTADLKGKVSLINFWATSCTNCVAEMPQIVSTFDKYKNQGYQTIAVAMSYDAPSYVVNFTKSRKLPFQVALDNTGEVAKAWGDINITPTTFLIDKQGNIVKRYVGAPDFAESHQLIEKLLAA